MGYYGEQLKERMEQDLLSVKKNERRLADTVSIRKKTLHEAILTETDNLRQIEMIAGYYHLEVPPYQPSHEALPELIDLILQPTGIMKRSILLDGPWWKDGDAPILVRRAGMDREREQEQEQEQDKEQEQEQDKELKQEHGHDQEQVLALFPDTFRGYYYRDSHTNHKIRITKSEQGLFSKQAYCFYCPLPAKPLSGKEFLLFMLRRIRTSDLVMYVAASILLAVIGTLPTYVTQIAISNIVPSRKSGMLISLFVLLVTSAVCSYLMGSSRFSLNLRIQNRLDVVLENSVYARIINLPAAFFKNRTSGSIAQKVSSLNKLPKIIGDILMMLTNILISFVSVIPIFTIVPQLAAPAVVCLLAALAVVFISMLQETRLFWKEMTGAEENSGMVYGLISGIERLRVSGSEQRAYARWLRTYSKKTGATFAVRFPLCARSALIMTVRLLGLLWAFAVAWKYSLTVAQLAAFSSAFGIALSCIDQVANHSRSISRLKPILDRGKPILEAVPESAMEGKTVSELNGKLELKHVTFRYAKDEPAVLSDLSLYINPGEYVAIVGKSGCGKTTLVKLLLGFESPDRGTILYDGNDMRALNLHSLRRKIGTVLQDGRLFSGDIYSNITITAPWLGMDEAWEAAEKVGIAEDIRKMPLGMHTWLGEGGEGLSGGQKQRLMIARAIAPKPGLIILDEATSALDNLTQKIVTDSMDAMKCTRIVIAHRLSTIQACDRIIALDQGRIVESGTYEELIRRDGFFAELVKRQQVTE